MFVCVLGAFWGTAFFLQISLQSGSSEVLTCVSTGQARAKCSSAFWAQSGPRHFSCKFPIKWLGSSDVSCDMWTRISTAQARTKCVSARSGLNLGRGLFLVNFR